MRCCPKKLKLNKLLRLRLRNLQGKSPGFKVEIRTRMSICSKKWRRRPNGSIMRWSGCRIDARLWFSLLEIGECRSMADSWTHLGASNAVIVSLFTSARATVRQKLCQNVRSSQTSPLKKNLLRGRSSKHIVHLMRSTGRYRERLTQRFASLPKSTCCWKQTRWLSDWKRSIHCWQSISCLRFVRSRRWQQKSAKLSVSPSILKPCS